MSNLYKELVQEIAKSWRYFVYKPSPGEEQCLCFFCHAEFGCPHEPSCLVEQAKTLLAQNPDSEEENPWMPKPKPYQPPVQPITEPEKPPEPGLYPLMGWTPEWKEKPKVQRCVQLIVKGFGSGL